MKTNLNDYIKYKVMKINVLRQYKYTGKVETKTFFGFQLAYGKDEDALLMVDYGHVCCEDYDVILVVWSEATDVHAYVDMEDNTTLKYIRGLVESLEVRRVKYDAPIPREVIMSIDMQLKIPLSDKDTGSTNLQVHFNDSDLMLAIIGFNHHNGCYPHEFVVRYNGITDEDSI